MDFKRALIVDDSPLADELRAGLESHGYEVVIERAYTDGCQSAHVLQPSLAVIEWDWKDRTGVELIADLRRAHEDTTVVVVTTFASVGAAEAALRAGAADYLIKPVSAGELLAAIEESNALPLGMSLQDARREYIREVLMACNGSLAEASRILRVERTSLRRMMVRLGLRASTRRGPQPRH